LNLELGYLVDFPPIQEEFQHLLVHGVERYFQVLQEAYLKVLDRQLLVPDTSFLQTKLGAHAPNSKYKIIS
jgi:hypothetical protein